MSQIKYKVDNTTDLESSFTVQVKHLVQELKKIDLEYTQEKMQNSRTVQRFTKKVTKMKEKFTACMNQVKDFEFTLKQ